MFIKKMENLLKALQELEEVFKDYHIKEFWNVGAKIEELVLSLHELLIVKERKIKIKEKSFY